MTESHETHSNGTTRRDPRHDALIERVRPSRRGLAACRELAVITVGDFLRRSREEFLSVFGCGPSTYRELDRKVRRFLEGTESAAPLPEATDPRHLLAALMRNPRVARVFKDLGIDTIQQFLARPRTELLAVPGFGEKSYDRVLEQLRAFTGTRPPTNDVLPARLLQLPLEALSLQPGLLEALHDLELQTVGDTLHAPGLGDRPEIGALGLADLREALDTLLRAGLDQVATGSYRSFAQLTAALLATLSLEAQDLLRLTIGLGRPPLKLKQLARRRHTTVPQIRSALDGVRRRLLTRASTLLRPMRTEAQDALDQHEGVVTPDCLEPGTALYEGAHESSDSVLPLRLLCFCYPTEFYLQGNVLTRTAPSAVRTLRRRLHHATRPAYLPTTVSELEQRLATNGHDAEHGLVLHVLLELGLSISHDPDRQCLVVARRNPVADRIAEILEELERPLALEDLVFHYRDRHRSCHQGRLLWHLRADARMVEIRPNVWGTQSMFATELAQVKPEVERIADAIRASGHRCAVRDLVSEDAVGAACLITSCLRRDPTLRDLGRGEFCPADQQMSGVMQEIHGALTRAMGELPVSRFLSNQSEQRRRVVSRLLRNNRMFVEPSVDRVDLLTNYPFNRDRLAELQVLAARHLDARGGYSRLDQLLEAIQQTHLGGHFLNEHLLGDLLRRHTTFEVLPGGYVAHSSLGLGGWIQHKAREALRHADLPLTPEEIVAEVPELSEFAAALESLLENDPLVQSADMLHYSVL